MVLHRLRQLRYDERIEHRGMFHDRSPVPPGWVHSVAARTEVKAKTTIKVSVPAGFNTLIREYLQVVRRSRESHAKAALEDIRVIKSVIIPPSTFLLSTKS